MEFDVVIGLEVHAELATKTKMYCGCKNIFGGRVNSNCCEICLGMPGTLPALNRTALEYAIEAGLAFNCDISRLTSQARKSYFYPDLPKSYQISQSKRPLCVGGFVEILLEGGKKTKRVGLRQIHIEEDAGKLIHDEKTNSTLIDYNRSGVPLIEIVSLPELTCASEVRAFLETIRNTLICLKISDCKMQEGSLRSDINISLKPKGSKILGTKCEIKNVGSFSGAVKAVECEVLRQNKILESGGKIEQQTMRWDEALGENVLLRDKGDVADYRYFEDPDLPIINIEQEEITRIKNLIPELPNKKILRMMREYDLSYADSLLLIESEEKCRLLEEVALVAKCPPKQAANWILGDVSRVLNEKNKTLSESCLTVQNLGQMLNLIEEGSISNTAGKTVLEEIMQRDVAPAKVVEEKGLRQVSDIKTLTEIAKKVLAQNPQVALLYCQGKTNILGFAVGQCMKLSEGSGNPVIFNEILLQLVAENGNTDDAKLKGKAAPGFALKKGDPKMSDVKKEAKSKETCSLKKIDVYKIFKDIDDYNGQELKVCGWVKTIRVSKNLGFVELNDGTQQKNLQVVFEQEKLNNFEEIGKLNVGAAICVCGTLIETPKAQQPCELRAKVIRVAGKSSSDYPLQKKQHSAEFLRTLPHLRARTNMLGAAFRVRSTAAYAIHKFFHKRRFVYVHTPIITGSDCEGAGEMFRLTSLNLNNLPQDEKKQIDNSKDFFGGPAYLTVSGQLEGECMALAFGKIYTFGPTFRAENSNTSRHAAEFWMIEPEIAFANLEDDMELAQDMLKYVIKYVMKHSSQELEFFNEFIDKGLLERLKFVMESEVGRVTYTEAIKLLQESGHKFEYPVNWGCDLQTEHERYLTEVIFKKPIFVTHYPKEIKSFYMKLDEDGKTVAAMDMLVPGIGEIIGGSQREDSLEVLVQRIKECSLDKADYEWYLDLRRFGGTKHAGFGLGFERLIMYLTGISNIRDVQLFPRTAGTML